MTAFAYRPGASFLHRLDARAKLAVLIIFSLAALGADFGGLLIISLAAAVPLLGSGFPVIRAARELRWFSLLLAAVFVARVLTTPGPTLFSFFGLTATATGAAEGLLFCWRLMLVAALGLFLIAFTRPAEIRGAVAWFLRPAPFIPEQRAAAMMGLVVRFIPLIFEQAAETRDAQAARCVQCRRNPVSRVTRLAGPLMRRIFLEADELAQAMEARGYNDRRTGPQLVFRREDALVLAAALGAALTARLF